MNGKVFTKRLEEAMKRAPVDFEPWMATERFLLVILDLVSVSPMHDQNI